MFDKTASWKTPQNFLLLISIVVPIAFSSWMALLNNFVIEKANFDGADIGLLQSVREIPGLLGFYRGVCVGVHSRTTLYADIAGDADHRYGDYRSVPFTYWLTADHHFDVDGFSLL